MPSLRTRTRKTFFLNKFYVSVKVDTKAAAIALAQTIKNSNLALIRFIHSLNDLYFCFIIVGQCFNDVNILRHS